MDNKNNNINFEVNNQIIHIPNKNKFNIHILERKLFKKIKIFYI